MDKTLAFKVIEAINHAGLDNSPCSSELRPIAEKLGARLSSGCTRWAFVFEKHKMVVKFPKYEETDENYCDLELKNYNKAKECRVEKCLLPIEYVGTTDRDMPIYIQPMYTTSHDYLDYNLSKRWAKKVQNLHHKKIVEKVEAGCLYSPPQLWLERAIQIYGKRFMRAFEHWTRENRVNDLHSSNVGYLGKQPIIIDYAGYHG